MITNKSIAIEQNICVGITPVVMEETAHCAIVVVCSEYLDKQNNCAVQTEIILPRRVFPGREANTTAVQAIRVYRVACEFMLHE